MTITKILWAALSGCVGIILLMASAWARDVTAREEAFDRRLSVSESHYAAIQADLQDLREHVRELKEIMREQQRTQR